ncbi:MAG: transglutaminase domain protein [Holophagaceae bacterium]|nr:transglutaminase domain protein [Holophagaceae bacterium]
MSLARIQLVVPACMSLAGLNLPASTPWEAAPPFSAAPQDLIRTSASLPIQPGYAQQELLEEYHVSLDEAGRRTARYRYIFRIDQDSAIEGWGTVTADYTTWWEERPVIRARVITADGQEHALDPATIGDYSPEQESSGVFTDRRQLRAPLPKLAKGAIAEVEILWKDHRPFSRTGTRASFSLSQNVPVQQSRYTLEVPATAPLKWKLVGLPGIQPQSQTLNGRTSLTVVLGPTRPRKKAEPHQVPGQDPGPVMYYTTTPSWETAAAEYSDILEGQLKGAQLQAWVRQAVGGATDRMEILKRLVARMHKDVRYTGLEFGEASVVPRTPADTLKRGYGDCKDKSALLVAVLREAGIPAHLALLRAGSRQDVEPDMPGLSAFDHAIVYIPGPPSLWIDPTVPEAPVGELPSADLERQALVIGLPAPGLVTTPGVTAQQNLYHETKEVFLAEDGTGRIVETSEAQGPAGIQLRGEYLGVDPKRTRENLKGYVERAFKAKELGRLEYAHPEDVNLPFRLVLEAQKAGIANTGTTDAAVAANAWPLVEGLSNTLNAGSKDDSTEDEATAESKKPGEVVPRKTDLLLQAPYAMEARWIIHPPTGYAYDTLPQDQSVAIGPATLSMGYKGLPDGTVQADYRMDCPKRHWTPKEVNQGRAALKAFGETKIPLVVFQQVGEAFLGAGKTKEAMAEFRREMGALPTSADPLVRLARAQLSAGLAETARDSLRQAIRLQPSRGIAHQVQGWVLQHDWIGRKMKPGWDRKGAVEAYRRAIALDPKDRFARQNLAILLEHDADGERYAKGADLQEAARFYKALIEEEKSDALQDNLMVCLSKLGQLREAQEIARAREASPRRNAWLVGLEACLNGQEKAIALGRTLFPDLATRRATYLGAADVAVIFRKYAEASGLLNEGASGASDMVQVKGRAEILAKVRPFETRVLDLKDPRDAVRSMFLTIGDHHLTADRLRPFFSEANLTASQIRKANREQQKVVAGLAKQGLSVPVMIDLTMSLSDVTADGDDLKGYVVQAQMPGQSPSRFYVARIGTTCRLVGNELFDLARQALWHVHRGELGPARAWLDRLHEESRKPEDGDPLSGNLVRRLWEKGQQGTAAEIRLACESLLAIDKDENGAYSAVKAALASALPDPKMGAVARSAAIGAGDRKDFQTLDQATLRLVSLYPDSLAARSWRIDCLVTSGRWPEALEAVDAAIAKYPEEDRFQARKPYILSRLGRAAESAALTIDRIKRGKAGPGEFNNLAWWLVVQGKIDPETLDYARRSIQGTGASSSAAHHTLATVLAESGRTTEALGFLLKALELREEEEPTGADWYLLGRVAEQLGETAAAESYYRRVKPEPGELEDGEAGCPALAKRRLAALKAKLKG